MTGGPIDGPAVLRADLVLHRGSFRAEVGFGVADNEVLGLLGPNGAGKTSLLRALAGLERISSGRIVLDSTVLDDPAAGTFVSPEQRPVGLVFQNYRLFPHLSVRDNVAFGLRSRGESRARANELALRQLQRFGLADYVRRKPGQLSGGQAQRVALARALAIEPRLLLLDEPLAALDARTRLEVRAGLKQQLAEFDGPTVLVTHDPLEAMVLSDRLLVVEGGRIVQQGSPAEIARRPATQYVARLMGLNLYPGTRRGHTVVLDGGGTITISDAATAASSPQTGASPPGSDGAGTAPGVDGSLATPVDGGRALLAIRPSAIALHTVQPAGSSPRNVWPGRVESLELLVDRVRVLVRGQPDALVDVTAEAVAELDLNPGSLVWLSAKATEIAAYPEVP